MDSFQQRNRGELTHEGGAADDAKMKSAASSASSLPSPKSTTLKDNSMDKTVMVQVRRAALLPGTAPALLALLRNKYVECCK